MVDSATLSRAEQRKQQTATRLTSASRRLTAARGLNGFTIEEVCDEVGVSRRTFFNYFPSKEQAIIGVDEAAELALVTEEFAARGSRGWTAVVDDLVELVSEYVLSAGLDAAEHLELVAAVEREPKLLARFIGMGREREAELAALVAAREGVPADDPRARASIDLISTLMRSTVERILQPGGPEQFGVALHDSLAVMRELLTTPTPRKAQQ